MTDAQTRALELAGRVQYFTLAQTLKRGIWASETTARRHIRNLVDRGLLAEHNYGVQVGVGRLPTLYGLTPAGVRYLVDYECHDPDTIKSSKSNRNQEYEVKAPRDYHHRVGTIDALLALYDHLDRVGASRIFSELYFRKYGMHQPKRTSIELATGERVEPDAILHFWDENGRERLYLIELYEDSTEVERVRRSLNRHAQAIAEGSPSIARGAKVGHRVLLIFRHDHTARAVMQYLVSVPTLAGVLDRFLFATLDAMTADPFSDWADAKKHKKNLY